MTIASEEFSAYSSEPVILYRFTRGLTNYRFAADTDDVTGSDGTYTAANIKPNEPRQDADGSHSTLILEVPRDFQIVQMFQGGSPGSSIWLTMFLTQRGVADAEVLWSGKVRSVILAGSLAKLSCDPMDKVWLRNTLREDYGCQCSRRLYACGVNADDWTLDGVVTAVSTDGTQITADVFDTQENGWWLGGDIYFTRLDSRRMIVAHADKVCTVNPPTSGVQVGDAIKVRRGCDHLWKRSNNTWGDCKTVFDNTLNFKGWPFTPSINPFNHRF